MPDVLAANCWYYAVLVLGVPAGAVLLLLAALAWLADRWPAARLCRDCGDPFTGPATRCVGCAAIRAEAVRRDLLAAWAGGVGAARQQGLYGGAFRSAVTWAVYGAYHQRQHTTRRGEAA